MADFKQLAEAKVLEKLNSEKNGRGYRKMLGAYFKNHRLKMFTILFLAMITSALAVSAPLVMREIMSNLQGQSTSKFIIWNFGWKEWIYVQLGMYVVLGTSVYFLNLNVGMLGKNIEQYLRNEALKGLIMQDISYYSDKKIGEILTKIGADTWIVGEQTQNIPTLILMAFFNFVGSSVVLMTIDWKLGLIAVGLVGIGVGAILIFFGRIKRWIIKLRTTITYVNGDVTDRIATIRLIKASGTEVYEKQRFRDLHVEFMQVVKSFFTRLSAVLTCGFLAVMSLQLIILSSAYGLYHNNDAQLYVIATSFLSGLGTLTSPIYQVLRILFGYMMSDECTKRVFQIIDAPSRVDGNYFNDSAKEIKKLDKGIIFKDVVFNYPEDPSKNVLPKFNFTFEKGKSYAFVGETGSGKSTISKLLLRFYDPTEGEVLINEEDNLKDIKLKSYLDLVGYVEQEPQIIFGNVKDNIRYTTPWKTDEEVIEAAKKVNLHELIMSWPLGYDTILGERGFMLSGGQKQRLVIARMFLKNPQLLILDEATSALDNIVEKEVQAELEKLMEGRTSVVIAHRLSTIKNCDQINVLAPGQGVVQTGSFEELKDKPGHFKRLYDAGKMREKEVVA
ncbi:ATP-binding cassette, subfamily B, bacterial [Spiroplasma chinense]|uniref:ATP-binding cassette, subfamily B, bacterial n=1 Tax=Spiroplasma chinense TaxID=216932 RepID=A0A5B9Y415_9MOLU|nr:ABC transporter ATP-binding protein [Spiroplasma chinense]QEH61419.1 ATP-binding cassette, subfamily B, bacterial [Spiroplasma chinense]